ncbi:MAG: NADH-quinone oxidoreductase subunit K [Bacteroidetes bacterium 4572_112]|nr:MAG: NADH-quinone oxidoreductase subunit K [Bacteroidetes bacterium 4572_112]
MILGVSIYEVLTLSTIIFFIGVFGFTTRKNLIAMLMSVELILNSAAINFVIINKYLYPEQLEGGIFSLFIIAIAAAETALALAIIINLYRLVMSLKTDELETMKY